MLDNYTICSVCFFSQHPFMSLSCTWRWSTAEIIVGPPAKIIWSIHCRCVELVLLPLLWNSTHSTESLQDISDCYWEIHAVIEAKIQTKLMKCSWLDKPDLFRCWTPDCQETLQLSAASHTDLTLLKKLCSMSHNTRQNDLNTFTASF